jgi:hypothetical protein
MWKSGRRTKLKLSRKLKYSLKLQYEDEEFKGSTTQLKSQDEEH